MNHWEILNIKQTTNRSIIQKAYADLTITYHPEEFPEEFRVIHQAYILAMAQAKREKKISNPVDSNQTANTYKNNFVEKTIELELESAKKKNTTKIVDLTELSKPTSIEENQPITPKIIGITMNFDFITDEVIDIKKDSTELQNNIALGIKEGFPNHLSTTPFEVPTLEENKADLVRNLEEEFSKIIDSNEKEYDLLKQFEQKLYELPIHDFVTYKKQWVEFLHSNEILESSKYPKINDILIQYLECGDKSKLKQLIFIHLLRLPSTNRKVVRKTIVYLRKNLLFEIKKSIGLSQKSYVLLGKILILLIVFICLASSVLFTKDPYADEIEEFYEEKYQIDVSIKKRDTILNEESKYQNFTVTIKEEDVKCGISEFSTRIEKDSENFFTEDDYQRTLFETISNELNDTFTEEYVVSPFSYNKYKYPEDLLLLTYDPEEDVEVYIDKILEAERLIQNSYLLDGTTINIQMCPMNISNYLFSFDTKSSEVDLEVEIGVTTDFDTFITKLKALYPS